MILLECDQGVAVILGNPKQSLLVDYLRPPRAIHFSIRVIEVSDNLDCLGGLKGSSVHNPHVGCYWFAGGESKGGTSYGETDEIGHKAAVNKPEIHVIHATILHLLGMDHKKLTYLHSGRRFRLIDVAGNVINDIVA